MPRIAILGAGFMGSALTVPATDNGHTVALWGTHLDDHLIAAVRAGAKHPKLGLVLPARVTAYDSTELPRALAGADLVISAVTSDGALPVLRRAATRLAPGVPVLSVSKGLAQSRGRAVNRFPNLLSGARSRSRGTSRQPDWELLYRREPAAARQCLPQRRRAVRAQRVDRQQKEGIHAVQLAPAHG